MQVINIMANKKTAQPPENLPVFPAPPPDFWQLLKIWLRIGLQSFGGGPSTQYLIRTEMIYKRGWYTEEEYSRTWVLCQFVPGPNLISLTISIGNKFGGPAGIFACLFGLLFPSALITTAFAAGFVAIQGWPPLQAMLKGLTPATAGLSLAVAVQFARPLLKRGGEEGKASLGLSVALILMAVLLVGFFKFPVAGVFIFAGFAGAFGFVRIWKRA